MTVSYYLPFPPSVNDMYANNKGSSGRGRYPTAKYKQWKEAAGYILNTQKHVGQGPIPDQVRVDIHIDETRQGDCDNRIKPVLDVLVSNGILAGDSKKYIKGVSVEWTKTPDSGCVAHISLVDGYLTNTDTVREWNE